MSVPPRHPPPAPVITPGRAAVVGDLPVTRMLPGARRRTVGAWCFVDHMGPASVGPPAPAIPPHPHIGLQTVTWLVSGEVVHRDSLGSEQVIRPGQLNLMTAGRGVSHSEEGTGSHRGVLHGVQLWVAQPEATRNGEAGFEHHGSLPVVEVGKTLATVLVGTFAGSSSPARRDTNHFGAELVVEGQSVLPLDRGAEHALVVLEGEVAIEDSSAVPGRIAYLPPGREELAVGARHRSRVLLIGGVPFDERIVMWWNYVARTRDEIDEAHRHWTARTGRFGRVDTAIAPVDVPGPPWGRGLDRRGLTSG